MSDHNLKTAKAARYLTPGQDARLRRWERWNQGYFLFAFAAVTVLLLFSSELGLSSRQDWGVTGILLAILVAPVIALQWRLRCPACERPIGWQAKLMAPEQCRNCGVFLRASANGATGR